MKQFHILFPGNVLAFSADDSLTPASILEILRANPTEGLSMVSIPDADRILAIADITPEKHHA